MRKVRNYGLGCLGLLVVAFVALMVLMPSPDEEPEATPVPTSLDVEDVIDATKEARAELPTSTPAPTVPQNTEAGLRTALSKELGKGNRDARRLESVTVESNEATGTVVTIRWAINDNLTEGMIRTGARSDAFDILGVVASAGFDDLAQVDLEGTFSMLDQYGNASEDVVVDTSYTGETVARINYDNILVQDSIFEIADGGTVHPLFRE